MEFQEYLLENCNRSLDNYNHWIPPEFSYYKRFIGVIKATVEKYNLPIAFCKEYLPY